MDAYTHTTSGVVVFSGRYYIFIPPTEREREMGEFVWGKKMVEGMMAAPSSSRHIQNDCVHKNL
jgi:hypothetical protein